MAKLANTCEPEWAARTGPALSTIWRREHGCDRRLWGQILPCKGLFVLPGKESSPAAVVGYSEWKRRGPVLAGHQIVDVATGQFAEPRNQVMRKQRSLLVFFVPLERDSERFSHERLRPAHRLARFLHASDETVIKFEFRIIEGHNQYCRRPFRHAKGTKITLSLLPGGRNVSPRGSLQPKSRKWAVRAGRGSLPAIQHLRAPMEFQRAIYSSTLLDVPNALEAANIEFLPGNGSRLRSRRVRLTPAPVPSPIERLS